MHPLDAWLKANKRNRLWLADRLGTTEASISRIVSRRQWPGREFFERLAKLTKGAVTADDFLEVA